eukprot:4932799-Pyramimonas_sp.AAC.1
MWRELEEAEPRVFEGSAEEEEGRRERGLGGSRRKRGRGRRGYGAGGRKLERVRIFLAERKRSRSISCLLYTSDAADDTPCVDL